MSSAAPTRRAALAPLACLALVPAALRAQSRTPAAPARPEFQLFRFEESWPAHGDARPYAGGRDPFDALKHVALLPGDALVLTVNGQLRVREEAIRNFQLSPAAGRDDDFSVTRFTLAADVHVARAGRLYVEGRHAFATGRELPGGPRPQDEDRWDLQNAFAELSGHVGGGWTATGRVGRQELLVGKERLVGPGDWSNARRTFEGARGVARHGTTSAELFWARPVVISQHAANHADSATWLSGAVVTTSAPRHANAQLYAFDFAQRATTLAGVAGAHRRATLGGRVWGRSAWPWLAYEVEGGAQRGHLAGRPARGWFVASELTASAPKAPLAPSLGVGLDHASGDADSTDRTVGTFSPLLPSAHSYTGYVDVVGRQNLDELRLVATLAPVRVLQLRASLERFRRAELADGAYGKNGLVLRAPGGSRERAVGDEVDVGATLQAGRHLRLLAGYGHFAPGAFLRHTAGGGGAAPLDWGYAGTTYTF